MSLLLPLPSLNPSSLSRCLPITVHLLFHDKLVSLFPYSSITSAFYRPIMGKIIENYELRQQLGEGVYAKVYKAVHLQTKQEVAIKVVGADKFRDIPKLQECTVNEINILSTLQSCPYIVKYMDMLKTANNFYFVYEYCNGGTMDKLMQREGPFPEKRALFFFRQMVEAFKVLSKANIMHRDIKPDNILLHNGNIKIADFGFCKPLESQNDMVQTMLGSPIYMAPEVIKGEVYTSKADIWSLGVVLYQMLFGKCPFESKSIAKLIQMLDQEDVAIPDYPKTSPVLQKLLKRILVKDFTNRIDWKDIFDYTFTEQGDLFPPGAQQFGLRASIRNSSGFGQGLAFNPNSSFGNFSNTEKPLASPKGPEDTRNYLMKKKSPLKAEELAGNLSYAGRSDPQGFSRNNDLSYRNEQFSKDRSNRLELLLKNHGKCSTINLMVLDLFRQQQPKHLPISYFLFRSIEKELLSLGESLAKDGLADREDTFRELRQAVEKELEGARVNLALMTECIEEEGDYAPAGLEASRAEVMRGYLEGCSLAREEEMVLVLQVVDFLEESVLIKKDAYQKLSRQNLLKQLRYKFTKYGVEKDFS